MSSYSGPFNEGSVTKGLVFSVDASEPGSYSGSGTIWNDLSSYKNNLTISGGVTGVTNNNSAYFDGSSDFLTLSNLTSGYLAGDWTIEGWVYMENQTNQMFFNTIPHQGLGISLNRSGSGQTALYIGNGTWQTLDFRSSGTLSLNAWHHVAVTKYGNAITIWHNGVNQGTTTTNMPSGYGTTAYIGTYDGGAGENVKGYISGYRITRRALYTANFTPPVRLDAVPDCELLTLQGGFANISGSAVTVSTSGNVALNSLSPYPVNFKSLRFDGTGTAIEGGSGTASLTFTTAFTIDATFKVTGYKPSNYYGLTNVVLAKGPASTYNYLLQVSSATTISFVKRTNLEGLMYYTFTVPNLTDRVVNVSLTYGNNRLSLYLNGEYRESRTVTDIVGYAYDQFSISQNIDSNTPFTGEIYKISMYNIELTKSQIQQNYSSIKERFGLPDVANTPPLITEGRVLHLEAGNVSSYPKTGSTWFDLTTNANNGTLYNSPTYTDVNNGILNFNGSNQYALCGSSSTMNLGNIGSIAAWVKTSSTGVWKWICQYGRHTATLDRALVINDGNKALFYMYQGANAVSTTTVTDGRWHYLVGTIDGTFARIYVDGVLEATTQPTFGAYSYSGVRVGVNDGLGSYFFNGSIAHVMMYNRTLSANEVLQNYQALKGRFNL